MLYKAHARPCTRMHAQRQGTLHSKEKNQTSFTCVFAPREEATVERYWRVWLEGRHKEEKETLFSSFCRFFVLDRLIIRMLRDNWCHVVCTLCMTGHWNQKRTLTCGKALFLLTNGSQSLKHNHAYKYILKKKVKLQCFLFCFLVHVVIVTLPV